jgi:hypothetical protein
VVSFPQVSPPKPCTHLSSPPYALHVPPISFFSTWSPGQYLSINQNSEKECNVYKSVSIHRWCGGCETVSNSWTLSLYSAYDGTTDVQHGPG